MSEVNKAAAAGKYLTFALAQEEYGLLVIKVRESVWLTAALTTSSGDALRIFWNTSRTRSNTTTVSLIE